MKLKTECSHALVGLYFHLAVRFVYMNVWLNILIAKSSCMMVGHGELVETTAALLAFCISVLYWIVFYLVYCLSLWFICL